MDSYVHRDLSYGPHELVVEASGQDEWIVGTGSSERALHVYRFDASGWLVSEVGRVNEGRGAELADALAALAGGSAIPAWWHSVARAIADQSAPEP
jgi:hypothetical protein